MPLVFSLGPMEGWPHCTCITYSGPPICPPLPPLWSRLGAELILLGWVVEGSACCLHLHCSSMSPVPCQLLCDDRRGRVAWTPLSLIMWPPCNVNVYLGGRGEGGSAGWTFLGSVCAAVVLGVWVLWQCGPAHQRMTPALHDGPECQLQPRSLMVGVSLV